MVTLVREMLDDNSTETGTETAGTEITMKVMSPAVKFIGKKVEIEGWDKTKATIIASYKSGK